MWQLQLALVLVLVLRLSLVPDAGLALGLRLLTNAGGKLTATNLTVVTLGNTPLESELKRFMESLLIFVYGQSDELGAILCQFCKDPGMNDTDFGVRVRARVRRDHLRAYNTGL